MTVSSAGTGSGPQRKIDTTVAHSARIWNYWLGGKDNFAADRAAGDKFREVFPDIVDGARECRAFLVRAVTYLARDAGVRQFLDIGTGLPTSQNTHEVAQRVAPECRVVYVDNDPLVLAHARALLTSEPEGVTEYIDADLREPDKILAGAAETLDLTRPTALMLLGILGHISDAEDPRWIVRRLLDGLPAGSYLAVCDAVPMSEAAVQAQRQYNEDGAVPYHLRRPAEIARFFDGLELLDPGVVDVTRWRPGPSCRRAPVQQFGGVGRKP
ncbi:MAG TPA: SAM-dependent methyltransferase [Micromonosporaceae bacterium]|nr:SAM-dependent methyltransferase [Micromonosporaceae bacterium]